MDCPVCLEDNVIEINIHYMECLHFICDDCFRKFLSNSCPLCRQEITLMPFNNRTIEEIVETDIDLSEDNEMFFDDFIIPTLRKNRSEYKRKKMLKKKEKLDRLINHQMNIFKNNLSSFDIPNKNKRFYNKTSRILTF